MEHPDQLLFPGLAPRPYPGAHPPAQYVQQFGGGYHDNHNGGAYIFQPRGYGDYLNNYFFRSVDASSAQPNYFPTGYWECSVEDMRYVPDADGTYVPESNLWVDCNGERIYVKPRDDSRVVAAVVRLWQQSGVVSLRDLCIRHLSTLPKDELTDMCQQFMGVKTLPEVLPLRASATIQRILRNRYDRFLVTHHYMARVKAPNCHLSLFAPTPKWRGARTTSDGASGVPDNLHPSYSGQPRCSFAAWMRYYRMRTELPLICDPCKKVAEVEMRFLTDMKPKPVTDPYREACRCGVMSLSRSIWRKNRYLFMVRQEHEPHRRYKPVNYSFIREEQGHDPWGFQRLAQTASEDQNNFNRYTDWIGKALIKRLQIKLTEYLHEDPPFQPAVHIDVEPVIPLIRDARPVMPLVRNPVPVEHRTIYALLRTQAARWVVRESKPLMQRQLENESRHQRRREKPPSKRRFKR